MEVDARTVPRIDWNELLGVSCKRLGGVRDELVRWPLEYCESNLKLSRAPAEWVSVDHDP